MFAPSRRIAVVAAIAGILALAVVVAVVSSGHNGASATHGQVLGATASPSAARTASESPSPSVSASPTASPSSTPTPEPSTPSPAAAGPPPCTATSTRQVLTAAQGTVASGTAVVLDASVTNTGVTCLLSASSLHVTINGPSGHMVASFTAPGGPSSLWIGGATRATSVTWGQRDCSVSPCGQAGAGGYTAAAQWDPFSAVTRVSFSILPPPQCVAGEVGLAVLASPSPAGRGQNVVITAAVTNTSSHPCFESATVQYEVTDSHGALVPGFPTGDGASTTAELWFPGQTLNLKLTWTTPNIADVYTVKVSESRAPSRTTTVAVS